MAYRISEAARRVGVSASALRQWERRGLVHPTRTHAGYRLYNDDDLSRPHRVHRLREVDGVNPPGIRRVLGGHAGSVDADGSRLRSVRRDQGLSLREAGHRSGLSSSFISAVERGAASPSVATLQRLTSAYQLSEGDALSFPSTLPHRWRNDASGET